MRTLYCFLLAGLLLTHNAAAQSYPNDLQIRSYQVPVEHQERIEAVLGEAVSLALGQGQQRRSLGVASPGRGQILVTAPPHIHEDIERFLRDFAPPEAVNLKTQYWIVDGKTSDEAGWEPELEPIAEVLSTIDAASVPMRYALLEHVEVLARAGADGVEASIPNGTVSQQLNYVGDKIVGDISLYYRSGKLDTEVAITPGRFVVLGRMGVEFGRTDRTSATLFLIIRSQLVE